MGQHFHECNHGFNMEKTIMTTTKRPQSGRAQENSISKLDKYNKDSKSTNVGRFMRTFARTKTSQLITAWDDDTYFTLINQYLKFLADVSGAVDSATVATPQMINLLNLAWETHYTNANLKDLVAGEETSWILYFAVMLQICTVMQVQYNVRTLLPAYTESDVVPGSAGTIGYFTQSSFDIFLASMVDFPVPKGIYELVNIWASWIIKISEEYERFTLRIPAGYIVPFACAYDLADLEAMRDLLRVNMGNAITHAKKFGLKMGTWSDPKAPVIKDLTDPDVIAYFNHTRFSFYDNTPGQQVVNPNGGFMGANLTTNYTGVEYMFKDTPNESPIHVLASWFGDYNATNLKYGGHIVPLAAHTTEYALNLCECAQHGTAIAKILMTDDGGMQILPLFKAYGDSNSAAFQISAGGTNFTGSQVLGGSWILATLNRLFMGLNRGAVETNNDHINYIGNLLV